MNFGERAIFAGESLNTFLALGRPAWRKTREILQHLLAAETDTLRDDKTLRKRAFHRQAEVTMLLPARIGDYTEFYSSYHHAFNVGTMFRGPENALMPNWKWLPIAYHGRASSIVPSGTDVRRPHGQIKPPDAAAPIFGASRLSISSWRRPFSSARLTNSVSRSRLRRRRSHVRTGVDERLECARHPGVGISAARAVPREELLHQHLAVGGDAGGAGAVPQAAPGAGSAPLPYLRAPKDFTYDIRLEVRLQTAKMSAPQTITRSNFQNLYWSMAQQLAHHTVGGCNLQPGDLLASGTISGPAENERGSMLELAWRGAKPLQLPGGEDTQMARGRGPPNDQRLVSGRRLPRRLRRSEGPDCR